MEQEELLRKIAKVLADLKIRYLITGGIATVVWGRPRFTADIDLVVELFPEKIDGLAERLLKIDKQVYVDKETISQALTTQGEFNFIHTGSGLKVDFWIMKGNDEFDRTRMQRRVRRKVAGVPIYLSSPEDLILIKLLWHKETESDRQIEDIKSILAIQKKLDWNYLRKWAKKQSTSKILKEASGEVIKTKK